MIFLSKLAWKKRLKYQKQHKNKTRGATRQMVFETMGGGGFGLGVDR